ncbi:MAG: hypothetical protein HYX92_17370 [Chloroflexi bacterium]|nr:hypothetical protein [Chloroflexota bacterium]
MAARLIDGYLEDIRWRRTVRNWPDDVRAIVDGYRAYTTIPHAVQKDAIQNAWSARKNRKGSGWTFTFELVHGNDRTFLAMTDTGSTGLTGRVLAPEEYELDLPGEERWGRFEGVAFTQPRAERTLGSRGRGKFIFVGASKESTIFYDTLREDGSYRFGFRTVIRTESPVMSYDGDEGKARLLQMTGGLIQAVSSVGSRVIIVSPVDELVRDLRSGRFLRHLGETWWEIIRDYDALIRVRLGQQEHVARIPPEFELAHEDSIAFKTWIKKNLRCPISAGECRVKNLHIVYSSGAAVPEDIRGIAIQRDGMKICTIEPKYLGREIAERLYGYVNFDSDTEEALLDDEGIEHYAYDFRRSLPGAIKRLVEDEVLRFAKEKLGWGIDAREVRRQQQRNAERRALVAANNFARALGIGAGPGVAQRGSGGARTAKQVRIHLDELLLPRPNDLRVNYGEAVRNIRVRVANDDDREVEARLKVFLRYYDKLVRSFVESDIKVSPHALSSDFGPFEIELTESDYPDKGKYTVVAKLASLMDEDKGRELDYKTKSFYIEEDPPMRGLFERCEAFGFPNEAPLKFWMGYSDSGGEGGLVLYYNLEHPGYVPVSGSEEDLAEYIVRIAAPEICRYDLMQEKPVLFAGDQTKDPEEVLKQERKVLGELIYKFRRGDV